jgi:hypothetical protein
LTFQQVGDELERLMPFTRKFLPKPKGERQEMYIDLPSIFRQHIKH